LGLEHRALAPAGPDVQLALPGREGGVPVLPGGDREVHAAVAGEVDHAERPGRGLHEVVVPAALMGPIENGPRPRGNQPAAGYQRDQHGQGGQRRLHPRPQPAAANPASALTSGPIPAAADLTSGPNPAAADLTSAPTPAAADLT